MGTTRLRQLKHIFKLVSKEIFTILRSKMYIFSKTMNVLLKYTFIQAMLVRACHGASYSEATYN